MHSTLVNSVRSDMNLFILYTHDAKRFGFGLGGGVQIFTTNGTVATVAVVR